MPCCFTKAPPIIAVRKAKRRVVHIPISSLTVANKASSMSGMIIKNTNIGIFLVLGLSL